MLEAPTPTDGLRWLYLDLNSYFASVEQQENSALRGKPIAVVPTMTDSTCAIAASYEAKAYGIRTGTKIYEAKQMCPNLICVLARHGAYVDYHHRVLEELERHLHVTKVWSIDEVACKLLGREQRRENAIALAERIRQGIYKNVGEMMGCSIGLAPNRLLAKIASDMKKPKGLTVMEGDEISTKLYRLDLTDLPGIAVNMKARLARGRVYTVEDFMRLSPKQARKIWGSVGGERYWYFLHGYDLPDVETKKSVVGHSRVLDPELRSPERARQVIRRLTIKAATRLRRYNLYAGCFTLGVRLTDGRRWVGERPVPHAQDNHTFLAVLDALWAQMMSDLGPRVHLNHQMTKSPNHSLFKKVSLTLSSLKAKEDISLHLFQQNSEDYQCWQRRSLALSQAMDRLNTRYGAETVQLGPSPKTQAGYVGTKIAFTRIPDIEEFRE